MATEILAAWLLQATLALTLGFALVLALRLPLRRAFGARIAYAAWWVVPACLLAPLLPMPTAAPRVFDISGVAASALPALVASTSATADAAPDWRPWLLGGWLLGVALTTWLFTRRQRAFEGRIQRQPGQGWDLVAEHGPAVSGLLRPRILLPEDFASRYTPQEQALVMAHERLHVLRGDVAAQGLASALRCLFWFNPFAHVAASAFRFDQELACDADVLARFPGSRRAYGDAMLKTQLAGAGLPIGCHWQSNHPLKERLNMLKQSTPGSLRRNAGRTLVALVLSLAAYGAWATQAKPEPAATRIALDFNIAVDGGAASTPKLIVLEGEEFALQMGDKVAYSSKAVDKGLEIEMVAKRRGEGSIHITGTLRRDGGEPQQAELVLPDSATAQMTKLETNGVVLQVRGHVMAADEPMPGAAAGAGPGASKAPQLAKLTSADDMSPPAYPKAALDAGKQGKVQLLVYIDASGHVTDARVESAQPAGVFDEAALAAARKWYFSEGARDTNGKRPQGWMRTEVEFHPDGAPKG